MFQDYPVYKEHFPPLHVSLDRHWLNPSQMFALNTISCFRQCLSYGNVYGKTLTVGVDRVKFEADTTFRSLSVTP